MLVGCCALAGTLEARMPVKDAPGIGSDALCGHHPGRHGHDFALDERLPVCCAERHAGDQCHGLKARHNRHALGMEGLVYRTALLRQAEQTRRRNTAARALYASISMGKQDLTIRIEKVGRPQLAQISGEFSDHSQSAPGSMAA